ncbi:MAG: hypothetical protein ACFFFB_07590 [Candidatus Heimdallarchaeota archaeon]
MTVIIPREAYLTVVAASVRFANRKISQNDWLEVNGVFIGELKGDDVIIKEAYPIMHQKLDKTAVIDKYEWSAEDNISYTLIDEEAFSRGLFTVGSWHSHPGFKVMLSHIDIRHLAFHQGANPNYFTLVFNPTRLMRQVEMPEKKGDPEIQLKDDPGFKIFSLDDINRGIEASYHTVQYHIEGYDSMEQLVNLSQKFVVEITNLFPKENLFKVYENFIMEKTQNLDSLLLGTEEYLNTLARKGESNRVSEVLENQAKEIRKFIAEAYIKIDNIKQFMNYLEFKERDTIIPKIKELFSKWDEKISTNDLKLNKLAKQYK